MTSMTWKINRLRLMGSREVAWRVQQLLRKKAAKWGWAQVPSPPPPTGHVPVLNFLHVVHDPEQAAQVCAEADRLLAGTWRVFALENAPLGFPPDWNRCPKTGTVAPLGLGMAIDYRNEALVGDIKYLWEPSRHLELVTLTLAWRMSRHQRYSDGALCLLESWLHQCPCPMGVHWASSLELAVRLLNWACAWQLLEGGGAPPKETLRTRWLEAIYQHCHFIAGNLSRHSSANNHLFGEYMGLFVASVVWPCWSESRGWRDLAHAGLEREALAQNFADGVNREQAVYYHHEVMDMMLLCQRIAAAAGISFSSAYLNRLERMAEFLHSLMDAGGQVPMIGDADDAQMVRLAYGPQGSRLYHSLLASCALLFERSDFKAKAAELDAKTRMLWGKSASTAWAALAPAPLHENPRLAYPEGGYYLLGADFGTPREVRALIDCGPLGFLSIAAHGHADALALSLSVGGQAFLVDPGTYAYHTQKRWRDYFRSTAAHNTVEIDNVDQSVIGGNFMWLAKARAQKLLHEVDSPVQRFVGQHDGYMRLKDPVMHRREVSFDAAARRIEVLDVLTCKGEHGVALSWHFAEGCELTQESATVLRAVAGGLVLTMRCEAEGLSLKLLRASDAELGGWISRRFDVKQPITTARWSGRIYGSTRISTRFSLA